MLNGYVTYDELKLITGFNDYFLNKLITKGLTIHEADLEYNNVEKPQRRDRYCQRLFNLQEVEDWLKVHIF
jgi:hypothetical protein